MADSLADDDLKLVAYTIVFAKPNKEAIMPRGQGSLVVTDNLDERQFVARLIADYVKKHAHEPEFARLIARPTDLRYLKVHYVVSRRWPREREDGSREIEALETIADEM